MEIQNREMERGLEKSAERNNLKPPIDCSRTERWGALLSAIAGYIYVLAMFGSAGEYGLLAFAAMLCIGTSVVYRDTPAGWESWIWLGCLWVCLLCGAFGKNRLWGEAYWLFAHVFGVYWVIIRSGRTVLDGSSRYFPVDVYNGGVRFPFRHFLLQWKVIWAVAAGRQKDQQSRRTVGVITATVIAVAAMLFCAAGGMLAAADPNFAGMT